MRCSAFLVLLGLPLFFGCKASVRAEARVSAKGETKEFNEPLDTEGSQEGSSFGESELGDEGDDLALAGARPDLLLAAETPSPNCRCLAVQLGQPSDPAFLWQAGVPTVNPSTLLVIAFASEGIECPGVSKDGLGASYWGYEERGSDVVVFVENARFGRPVTHGALIPRPKDGGQVLVRPRDKRVPYGAGATGGDCAVTTASGERSVPLMPSKDPAVSD